MESTLDQVPQSSTVRPRDMLLPLVLAQFLCSFAATTMNVAISNIASDLGTTVSGVQTAITVFTLTMAALMITSGKLGDSTFAATDKAAHVCPVGAILPKHRGYEQPIGKRLYDRQPISIVGDVAANEPGNKGDGHDG